MTRLFDGADNENSQINLKIKMSRPSGASEMRRGLIISLLIIIALAGIGGGFFYWQENQKAVAGLNKTLPEGVRVEKSLFGEDYWVKNKIDGYKFRVPRAWAGIKEIEYVLERTESGYTAASVSIEGEEGGARLVTIDRFKIDELNINLEPWARANFETFGLVGDFSKDSVGNFEIVKTTEERHLFGMQVYFFKKGLAIYSITNGSEDFIREIILNGKW